jgi:hypothetical protein
LNLIFYDPIAARTYARNFQLLMEMDPNIVKKLDGQFPASRWTSSIEGEGATAESIYGRLSALNSELYGRDSMSFLKQEAAYYERIGAADKSAKILSEMKEVEPKAGVHVATENDSYRWIKYIN